MTKTNLAICIKGHLRTWDKCKNKIFADFEPFHNYFDNVDYFMDTWDVQNDNSFELILKDGNLKNYHQAIFNPPIINEFILDEDKLKADFKNVHLAKLTVHKFNPQLPQAISAATLIQLASRSRKQYEREQNKEYDCVIFWRPDCIFVKHPDNYNYFKNVHKSKDFWALNYYDGSKPQTLKSGMPILLYPFNFLKDRWGFKDNLIVYDLHFYGNPGCIDLIAEALPDFFIKRLIAKMIDKKSEIYHSESYQAHITPARFLSNFNIPYKICGAHIDIIRRINIPEINHYFDCLKELKDESEESILKIINFNNRFWYAAEHLK